MTGQGPKSIQSYIGGDAVARARQSEMLRKTLSPLWAQVVGPDLARHSHPVRLEGRSLLVFADGSLWASRIRHQYAQYVQQLQQYPELKLLSELRVRVVPAGTPAGAPGGPRVERPRMSSAAGGIIEEVARDITDQALREALLKLSARAKKNS